MSGALGQLGGLASLAGVSIGGGESSEAQVAQEIMRSRGFIEEFINENNLAVEVFAAEGWDMGSNQLDLHEQDFGRTIRGTGGALLLLTRDTTGSQRGARWTPTSTGGLISV